MPFSSTVNGELQSAPAVFFGFEADFGVVDGAFFAYGLSMSSAGAATGFGGVGASSMGGFGAGASATGDFGAGGARVGGVGSARTNLSGGATFAPLCLL